MKKLTLHLIRFLKPLKNTTMLLTCIAVFHMFSLSAQTPRNDSGAHGLYINDQVPEAFYNELHRMIDWSTRKTYNRSLDKDRNKLIILDFWAHWCMPCLGSLKNMNEELLGEIDTTKVAIIPVTYEGNAEIQAVLNRFAWKHQSVINDSILSRYFPHQAIPHMVWIYKGKVIAMPRANYATLENINMLLAGKMPSVYNETDIKIIDPNQRLFQEHNAPAAVHYQKDSFKVGGYAEGYAQVTFKTVKTPNGWLYYGINIPIDQLLVFAYQDLLTDRMDLLKAIKYEIGPDLKSKLKIGRPKMYNNDFAKDSIYGDWLRKNSRTVEFRAPQGIQAKEGLNLFRQYLADYALAEYQLEISIDQSKQYKVPVLKCIGKPKGTIALLTKKAKPSDPAYRYFNGQYGELKWLDYIRTGLPRLPNRLFDDNRIVDQTNLPKELLVHMQFPTNLIGKGAMEYVQSELKRYNLKLEVGFEKVPILLLKEVKKHTN
ncbi:TlpA family protein disulfide reductase [Sphingobacterium sp. UBA1498]|uniref:TlpA family protein disulfide reductase n=1 Tax=Sphingobacterium sp. UBA1498 TaxID=1947481 RepID=UPI0025FF6355|nr:TlpA disulfide reductase family protein [Sphingobacterium sp. UBA1498]